jgi:poly(3-hydroxybutyrate) depolymerase
VLLLSLLVLQGHTTMETFDLPAHIRAYAHPALLQYAAAKSPPYRRMLANVVSGCSTTSATSQTRSVEHAGNMRTYHLIIPASVCSRATAAPVVFFFHGFQDTWLRWAKPLAESAEQHSFVVALPEGFGAAPKPMELSWNGVECCGAARDTNLDDVGLVRRIVAELRSTPLGANGSLEMLMGEDLPFAIGHSNGGFFASAAQVQASAAAEGRLFRGVATLAGMHYEVEGAAPTAVLMHHHRADAVVKYGGCCTPPHKDSTAGECCCNIADKHTGECVSAEDLFRRWSTINKCDMSAAPITWLAGDKRDIQCLSSRGCVANTTLCTSGAVGDTLDWTKHMGWGDADTRTFERAFAFFAHAAEASAARVPAKTVFGASEAQVRPLVVYKGGGGYRLSGSRSSTKQGARKRKKYPLH